MFEVTNQPGQRTITVTLSGCVQPEDMAWLADALRRATDTYEGRAHLVLVDLQVPVAPGAEALMEEALGHVQRRGGVLRARARRLVPVADAA